MSYTSRFDKTSAALCFLLFFVAFGVRFFAADYGYFHGDERINEAAKVLTGQLVPGQHFYPPFINYLNAVALAGLFAVGRVADWWGGAGEFRAQYFADPTVFYVTARMVTALTGALLAPLFYGVARAVGLDRGRSVIVALVAVLFPLGVFMAHIAKGDTGLATALVAVIWALLMRVQGHRRWDWALGLFVVLTLSFKHSAVFILAPMGLGLLGLLIQAEGARPALRSFGRAVLVVLVLWPVLNIGLLMDFRNFLDYQRIQAVMSLRTGAEGPQAGPITLLHRAIEIVFGMNPAMTVGAVLTPLMLWRTRGRPLRGALWTVWLSLAIGTVAVALMAGPRQPEHLWIANFAGFLLLAGLLLIELTEQPAVLRRVLAAGVFSVGLMLSTYGTYVVLKQAAAQPIQQAVGGYLQARYPDRKVLTSMALTIPQQKEAQGFELDRMARLARKYNVDLPDMASERLILHSAQGAVYFVNMPGVMYGLENVDENAIDYEVKAHAWPLQKEEWQLDYWLEQGFSVFSVLDFQTYAYSSEPEIRRAFFQRMEKDCAMVQAFAPSKPLFLEREVVIFDCAAAS
ncbi:ArnT family glycosyltransferase [Thalassobius sp. S69A]|uniref:ArnT family glycosyltransferase n=1 Tax=unclassified Thalassovita TaxID=2619711 RepID=UPI003C7EC4D4